MELQMKYVKPLTLFEQMLMKKVSEHGRFLGLDVGDKYVGLSISDSNNKIASPLRYNFLTAYECVNINKLKLFLNSECYNLISTQDGPLLPFFYSFCYFVYNMDYSQCRSVLLRTKTNIDLMAEDFRCLVSSFLCIFLVHFCSLFYVLVVSVVIFESLISLQV